MVKVFILLTVSTLGLSGMSVWNSFRMLNDVSLLQRMEREGIYTPIGRNVACLESSGVVATAMAA